MKKKENVVNGSTDDCRPGCIHEGSAGGLRVCNYLFDVGKPRPCPGGPDCTEYRTQGARGRHRWDKAKARELYDIGASVREIANAVDVAEATISAWLRREGLTPNGLKKQAAPAPPESFDAGQLKPLSECSDASIGIDVVIKFGDASISIQGKTAQAALLLLKQATQVFESLAEAL